MTAESSASATLVTAIGQRRIASALAVGSILIGVLIAVGGFAAGAVLVCIGLGLSGFVDRRLPILLMFVMLPMVAAFDDLSLTSVAGGSLSFRLLMTGGIVFAIGPWLLRDRVRPDPIGIVLLGFVVLLVALAPLNQIAPVHALPVIGRWAAYALAYLAGRRWFGSSSDFSMLVAALIVGMIVPAISGLILALAVLNSINNAMLFLDGQLVVWVIVGSALSQGPSSGRPASQPPSDRREVPTGWRTSRS